MIQNTDFWPRCIDASPVLPPGSPRARRMATRRQLLEEQAQLISSPRYPSFLLKEGIRQVREGVDQILMLIEAKQGS